MQGERTLLGFYVSCQQELFSEIELQYGSLSKRYKTLRHVFEIVGLHDFFRPPKSSSRGQPLSFRASHSQAFLARMVLNIPAMAGLRERLLSERVLLSLCGWYERNKVSSESTFSRAFTHPTSSSLLTLIKYWLAAIKIDRRTLEGRESLLGTEIPWSRFG